MEFYQTSDLHVDINKMASPAYSGAYMNRVLGPKTIIDWSHCDPRIPLMIVGDTSNVAEFTIATVLEAAEYFVEVYFLPGNHDYYGPSKRSARNIPHIDAMYKEVRSKAPNVVFLQSDLAVYTKGTMIIGCMGWYTFDAFMLGREEEFRYWKSSSNDKRYIRFDKMPDSKALEEMTSMAEMVRNVQFDDLVKEILVFTHTIPHADFAYPFGHPKYYLNGAYVNSAAELVRKADINGKIKHWGFGHTHIWHDRVKSHENSTIRYMSCARGYGFGRDGRDETRSKGDFPVLINSADSRKSAFED